MCKCYRVLLTLCLLLPLGTRAESLRVLLADSNEMPLASFVDGDLQAGLLFEVGNLLATQLGRQAEFMPLPRKRISSALEQGQGDVICNQNPGWLPGPFDWTIPFIPHSEIVLSDRQSPPVRQLSDLANVPLGTVLGFVYHEVDQSLGTRFIRDDSLSVRTNLLKLNAGRVHHIIIDQYVLEYQVKQGNLTVPVQPYLLIKSEPAYCAGSRRGQVPLAEVNQAIRALQRSGQLRPVFERYHLVR